MPYPIIIGRTDKEKKELGDKGLAYIGKSYVKMGNTSSLSNYILLDVAKPHTILIAGKKGFGKSYCLGVLAEEVSNLPEEVRKNISILIFDTMGIFFSMKYKNERQRDELLKWGLEPQGINVKVYIPKGKFDEYKEKKIPVDYSFSIRPSELNAEDWCNVFNVELTSNIGILIEQALNKLIGDYSIEDIIAEIKSSHKSDEQTKNAVENRFNAVKTWGLFDVEGTDIKDIIKPGEVSILDTSVYDDFNIKAIAISIICKKLFLERVTARKIEEINEINETQSIFSQEEKKLEQPLVWLFIDEAHELLRREGKTPASEVLTQLIREGRQPGISMVMATQQPGEIHRDVITQSDIVISFRVTAKPDIDALNLINQTYLTSQILEHMNNLPNEKGSAIILDDNSERIYSIKLRPKLSWHSGDTPSAVMFRKEIMKI
ncbi:MAG: DUF87 domain-containing protein [Nanoarchaeota archaeon]